MESLNFTCVHQDWAITGHHHQPDCLRKTRCFILLGVSLSLMFSALQVCLSSFALSPRGKKQKNQKKKQKTVRDRKRVCGRPVASVAHCAPAALPEESNGLTLIHQCAVACLSSPLTLHTVWPLGLISTHSTGPQHGRGWRRGQKERKKIKLTKSHNVSKKGWSF